MTEHFGLPIEVLADDNSSTYIISTFPLTLENLRFLWNTAKKNHVVMHRGMHDNDLTKR